MILNERSVQRHLNQKLRVVRQVQRATSQLKQAARRNNAFVFFICFSLILIASGCARKIRPFTADQAIEALENHSTQIHTERGRAWVSAQTPEQHGSFPATIAIDRTDPLHPQMRIEATDLLGSTHELILLSARGRLTWVDFDEHKIYFATDYWHGLPLVGLPDLLLGLADVPKTAKVSGVDADGFTARLGKTSIRYLMTWIDPGPRLALSGVEGEVHPTRATTESYSVHYSKYMDTQDFYLPQEASLKGMRNGQSMLELHVAWRERTWNEPIDSRAFVLPKSLIGKFQTEYLN